MTLFRRIFRVRRRPIRSPGFASKVRWNVLLWRSVCAPLVYGKPGFENPFFFAYGKVRSRFHKRIGGGIAMEACASPRVGPVPRLV